MFVPQANDLDKILDLPLAVADGVNSTNLVIKRYDFDARQVAYYIEAEGALGLVERGEGVYTLTDEGKKYRRLDPGQQKLMVVRLIIGLPITAAILGELLTNEGKTMSKDQIESVIKENTSIRGSTVPRRAECLLKWLKWVGDETNVLSVDGEVIRLRVAVK